jgi:hypothetical protein
MVKLELKIQLMESKIRIEAFPVNELEEEHAPYKEFFFNRPHHSYPIQYAMFKTAREYNIPITRMAKDMKLTYQNYDENGNPFLE